MNTRDLILEAAAARIASAIHEAMLTLPAPVSFDALFVVMRRDFPEIALNNGEASLSEWLDLLVACNLVTTTTDHDSGDRVYAARKP